MRVDLESPMLAVPDRSGARRVDEQGVFWACVPVGVEEGAVLRGAAGCYVYRVRRIRGGWCEKSAVANRGNYWGEERHYRLRQG
jgi:hypothetical protein